MSGADKGVIGFAEKLVEILEEGRFTATYKFAVLIALMDLCFETNEVSGIAPESLTTRQLAEKIIEIYWPHSVVYPAKAEVLSQNSGRQAKILSDIVRFRKHYAPEVSLSFGQAKHREPRAYERLVRSVEWTLVEMPLPRLQTVGISEDRFIYEIGWNKAPRRTDVTLYQQEKPSSFDNTVRFKPGAGEYLIQLNDLLRPLIYRKWSALVAQFNGLPDAELEDFLFGRERMSTAPVRVPIWEKQEQKCFYCEKRIREPNAAEVDHFLPWSRFPDNGIENLVVADARCNSYKRDFLAAAKHLEHWRTRFDRDSKEASQYAHIAESVSWDRHPDKTLGVARAIYLRLPEEAKLWNREREFVNADVGRIQSVLKTMPI